MSTLAWVFIWLIMTYISIFVRPVNLGIGMDIILWVPVVATGILTFVDANNGLIHNVQYLIYTLWFIYLIPQMTGSILTSIRPFSSSLLSCPNHSHNPSPPAAFMFLEDTAGRFFVSVLFIVLCEVFLNLIGNASRFMGDGGPAVHFLFAVQLFEYFFGALFFVNVTLDVLFWLLLCSQSFWLIFRNSGLGKDIALWTYLKGVQPKLREWNFPYFQNLTFESSRIRLYQQARMAVQYTICDFTVLIGIPLQYYLSTTYLTDITQLQQYAWFFQMTLCEHDQGVLYERFAIVAGFKLVFHILAHSLIFYKVRSYNHQSREYGLPEISFVGIFSDYLKQMWLYFIIVIIWAMKASYLAFSVLISANQSYTLKQNGDAAFQDYTQGDLFWLQDLLVFVGYRFVTPNTVCGAISNSTLH